MYIYNNIIYVYIYIYVILYVILYVVVFLNVILTTRKWWSWDVIIPVDQIILGGFPGFLDQIRPKKRCVYPLVMANIAIENGDSP